MGELLPGLIGAPRGGPPRPTLVLASAALALAACRGEPRPADPSVELGTGNVDSGFLPMHEGDDVVMWQVRHPWNRQVQVSLRAEDLDLAEDPGGAEPGADVEVGLYQAGSLVAGTVLQGAVPSAGPGGALDFLGLRAQVVTDQYEPFSGRATRIEAAVAGASGTGEAALGVVLWTPEDLCEADPPPPALAELGTGSDPESFVPLVAGQALPVEDGALRLSLRLSGEPGPLAGGALLDEVVALCGSAHVAATQEQAIEPSTWTAEAAWYLDVLLPLAAGRPPGPGEPLDLRATAHDACGRELVAEVQATLAP